MSATTDIQKPVDRDPTRASDLLPLVYGELRRLAAWRLAGEKPGQTRGATDLVHEAYLRIVGTQDPGWQGRRHFFAAAAEAIRRILVENARKKKAIRHGGGLERVDIANLDLANPQSGEGLQLLDEAMEKLREVDAACFEAVNLCYLIGFTQEEAAAEMEIGLSTLERKLLFAKAWLYREMKKDQQSSES